MIKKIRYVLNNENGGPNLEHLLGIAVTTIALLGYIKVFVAPITGKGKDGGGVSGGFAGKALEAVSKWDADL